MKRRIAIALLVLVAGWPLVHRGLVLAYGIDPWKLGGFAMYAEPTPPLLVALVDPARPDTAIEEATLSARSRQELDAFRISRHALGQLRKPDDLAAAVLAERPELAALVVVVQVARLSPATARMTTARNVYAYGPEGPLSEGSSGGNSR